MLTRRCGSGSAPTGSTAGRGWSPASCARRSTGSATRPSSSPGRRGPRTSGPRSSTAPGSGTSRGSPRPPTYRIRRRRAGRLGDARTSSTSPSSTRTTSSRRSRRCARAGVRDRRPLRLGAVLAPSTSSRRKRAFDVDLLAHGVRAGALRDAWGSRARGSAGASIPSSSQSQPDEPTPTRPLTFFYPAGFLSKRKPRRRGAEGVPPRSAATTRGWWSRARSSASSTCSSAAPSATRGSRSCSRTCRPTSTCACSPSADVCVAPSRWEGLGLHLYESMALGLPVITNDAPPMNEVIRDGENGLLVASAPPRAGAARGSPPTRRASATSRGRSSGSPSRAASRQLRRGVGAGPRAARLGAHRRRLRRADQVRGEREPDRRSRRRPTSSTSVVAERRPATSDDLAGRVGGELVGDRLHRVGVADAARSRRSRRPRATPSEIASTRAGRLARRAEVRCPAIEGRRAAPAPARAPAAASAPAERRATLVGDRGDPLDQPRARRPARSLTTSSR